MTEFNMLEAVESRIRQRVQKVLEQNLEACLTEEYADMYNALLQEGHTPEDITEQDVRLTILDVFLAGIHDQEERFANRLEKELA